MKRYQYSVRALRRAASTRQVQSASAETVVREVATTRRNEESSAISRVNCFATVFATGGRLVQRMTLSECGSAEATPCGYRSRRSRQRLLDVLEEADRKPSVAPTGAAN